MNFRQHIDRIAGSGITGERRVVVPSCARVRVSGEVCLALAVGAGSSHVLSIRGDDNILPHVRTGVRRGVLEIALNDGAYELRSPLVVSGTCGSLRELAADGGARVRLSGLEREAVTILATGASRIEAQGTARTWHVASDGHAFLQLMAADADVIRVAARGRSAVQLRGFAKELSIDARGTARITAGAPDFDARDVRVELHGAAVASVSAADGVSGRVHVPASLRAHCGGPIDVAGPYRREMRFGI